MAELLAVLKRAWTSPTLATWGALGTNAAKFVLVLPLVLREFAAEDVAVWYLMATLMQLQWMLDFGFGATASRYYAYAMGGAEDLDRPTERTSVGPNHRLMGQLYQTLRALFVPLALGIALLLAIVGTAVLVRPVSLSAQPEEAWMAWVIVLVGSTISFSGLTYSTYLQGTNNVLLLRRWETVTNVGAIASSMAVLLAGGGIVGLALATQAWLVLAVLRNRWLARRVEPESFASAVGTRIDRRMLGSIWRSAWRSGLGILMNAGVVRISAGVLAQLVAPATMASYLIAFNLLDRLNQFAMAPFYSRLPRLGALYARGEGSALLASARRGIWMTVGVFAFGAIVGGLATEKLLIWIGSDTAFIGGLFWGLLALGMLLHRVGAVHLQLYTLSNHVVWHIADGTAGVLFILTWLLLFPLVGVMAIPIGFIVAYGGFYTPFCMKKYYGWRKVLSGAGGPSSTPHRS